MEASNLDLLALVLFVMALAIGLEAWTRMSEAGRSLMATLESPPVKSDEQQVAEELALEKQRHLEALDAYNEACNMGPVKQPHLGPISPAMAKAHIGMTSQQVNQNSANMGPFCGEGKKP